MRMNKMKAVLALALAVALVSPVAAVSTPVTVAQAATKTVKLSAAKKTLNVGKSFTLKLKNASGKVTWKSNKKSVATVTSKGKVKAVASGTAKITATNKKKTYTCVVTVKNPKITTGMKDIQVGPVNVCYPKSWKKVVASEEGTYAFMAYDGKEEDGSDAVNQLLLTIAASDGTTAAEYCSMYTDLFTKEYLLSMLEMQGVENGEVVDCTVDLCDTVLGEAVMIKNRIKYYYSGTEKNYDEVKIIYQMNIDDDTYLFTAINEEGDYEAAQKSIEAFMESLTQL
ncbi:MAG: Ig-like domain-containing protein [bacterium]|nr:Ig-like domain-containing protein [bacterium]